MPLNFTSAHSSRITKSRKPPRLPVAFSSPRKGSSTGPSRSSRADAEEASAAERLPDVGAVVRLAPDLSFVDVVQAIRYVQSVMFSEIPERASGLNSTRTSEILNFRASLPPVVTFAHVYTLMGTPSATEREIARLTSAGTLRQVVIPGRRGGGLVICDDWQRLVESSGMSSHLTANYVKLLRDHSSSRPLIVPHLPFSAEEVRVLMQAGFLTAPSQVSANMDAFTRPGAGSLGTLTSLARVGAQEASGSIAAVGGDGAVHKAGGAGGGGLYLRQTGGHAEFELSLPSMGPYLRLLSAARAHLMSLLSKSKFKEAPLHLLRERWDGGIAGDDSASKAKRARGEFAGVLPGKTRKWKQFHGLRFEWVLGECVGLGLVELFETGTVGQGVRAR